MGRLCTSCKENARKLRRKKNKLLPLDYTAYNTYMLGRAALLGHLRCVLCEIVEREADVNGVNRYAGTALTCAAAGGHLDCLEILLLFKARLDGTGYDALLSRSNTFCSITNVYHWTKVALRMGIPERFNCWADWTALTWAAKNKRIECMKFLIDKGADLNAADSDGITPLVAAGIKDDTHLLESWGELYRKDECINFLLTGDSAELSEECIELLLSKGADVNAASGTALIHAVCWGDVPLMKILLRAGADVNIIHVSVEDGETEETTALLEACKRRNSECLELLLESRADVNLTVEGNLFFNRTSALCDAAYNDSVDVIKILLKAGVKVNIPSVSYIGLAMRGISDVHRLLLAAGEALQKIDGTKYFEDSELKSSLAGMCREVIRSHLLNLDPSENLFVRVPQLGPLPLSLQSFLLYDMFP